MSSNTACGAHKAHSLASFNSTEKLYQTFEHWMARMVLTQILPESLTVLSEKCFVCHSFFLYLLFNIYFFSLFVCRCCAWPSVSFDLSVSVRYPGTLPNQTFQGHRVLKPDRASWSSDLFLSCRSDLLRVAFSTPVVKLGQARNDNLLAENVLKRPHGVE